MQFPDLQNLMNSINLISSPMSIQKPKVLLLGPGFVGGRFAEHLAARGVTFHALRRHVVDYTVPARLKAYLETYRPSFVINAAGYTGKPNVDACEDAKSETLLGNAVLPGIIRDACEQTETPWGHVSSGCIFTGRRSDGSAFTEEDRPNFSFLQGNSSYYSGTKALGEESLSGASQCYIWRLRIPFDNRDSPRNYLSKLMRYDRLLDAENSISHLDDFVDACLRSWLQNAPFGTYNIVNPGTITTRGVVEKIRAHGLIDRQVSYFESEEEFMRIAARAPRSNCALSSQKLVDAGIAMRPAAEALDDALARWIPEAAPVSLSVEEGERAWPARIALSA